MIILLIFFLVTFLILYISLRKFLTKPSKTSYNLNFSIIIAAKNEGRNIPGLIESLKNLNYPSEKFEVIIIDDNSSDNTFELTKQLSSELKNFSVIAAGDNKRYPGKKGALDTGISKAEYPYILITDADCIPSEDWLTYYSGRFSEGYDIVFGPAPFYQTNSLMNKISCFENLRASLLVFGAAELNFSYSAMARNFGFKKSSFENIGGYSNTVETLGGDDDLLLREAVKHKMKIGTINHPGAFVYSIARESLDRYLKQKKRHTKTSLHYLPSRQLLLTIWHTINIFALFYPLISMNPDFIPLFFLKLFADFSMVSFYQKKFGYTFSITEKIYLQIYYEIFLIINFFNALVNKDKW
ncbi:MAG: glycosyltransferase [Ignavibacteriaceae bacterium]